MLNDGLYKTIHCMEANIGLRFVKEYISGLEEDF